MGFSEHLPFKFPNGSQSFYRLKIEETNDYLNEIKMLKHQNADKIEIKIGFEMEYYEEYFDEMLNNALEYGAEYLILGQHFLAPEDSPNSRDCTLKTNNIEHLKKYFSLVTTAVKKNIFTYVAHPDILNFTGDINLYLDEFRNLCIVSREYNTPLEINFLGIRRKRHYPNFPLWKVAGQEKAPVTFGFDSHDPLSAYDSESLKLAEQLVNSYNLNYIGKPTLKKL